MCNAHQGQPYFEGITVRGPVAANYMPKRELSEIAEEFNLRFPLSDGLVPSTGLYPLRSAIRMASPDGEVSDWVQTRTHAWACLETWLFVENSQVN